MLKKLRFELESTGSFYGVLSWLALIRAWERVEPYFQSAECCRLSYLLGLSYYIRLDYYQVILSASRNVWQVW